MSDAVDDNIVKIPDETSKNDESVPAAVVDDSKEREEAKGLISEIMDLVRSPRDSKTDSTSEPPPEADKPLTNEKLDDEKTVQLSVTPSEPASKKEENVAVDDVVIEVKNEEKKDDTNNDDDAVTKAPDEPVDSSKDEEESTKPTEESVTSSPPAAVTSPSKENEIVTPFLLSDEDIISRGVAESDTEMYRKFYLKSSYTPKAWYDLVKDHTFPTEFLVLSLEEVDALLAMYHSPNEDGPEVSDQIKSTISQLSEKIDAQIQKFGDSGVFIKLNSHSPRDAILDACDQDILQKVEDGIQNELEIEQQFVNAYLNWRSWRSMSYRENSRTKLPSDHRDNVVRRSFRRIQKSFKRQRSPDTTDTTATTTGDKPADAPLAEVDDKKVDDSKEKVEKVDEPTGEKEKEKENEDDSNKIPKDGEKVTDTVEVPVTLEATVDKNSADDQPDGNDDKNKNDKVASDDEKEEDKDDKTTVDKPTEDGDNDAADEPVQPKTEDTDKDADRKKEEEEPEIVEVKSKDETTKVDETKPDSKGDGEKKKRGPPPMLAKEHHFIKVKSETRGNKVLRAFIKTITSLYRINNSEDAIKLLTTSRVIKEDLEQVKVFANITGTEAILSIQCWHDDIVKYCGMQFRAFVYKGKLTGISQKDDVAYIPNIVRYKETIERKITQFFNVTIKESLKEIDSYVVDIFVGANKLFVVDLYPFHITTGACLFTWQQNNKTLINGPLIFRYIPTPYKNCFSGLQPHWQQLCNAAVNKKATGEQRSNTSKCVIL